MTAAQIEGFVCLACFIGVFVLIAYLSRGVSKFQKELPARIARARPGKGTVTSIRRGSIQNQGATVISMCVGMMVEAEGEQPYKATGFWEVRDVDIPQVQPGTVHDVMIDAEEPQAIYSKRFSATVHEVHALFKDRLKKT